MYPDAGSDDCGNHDFLDDIVNKIRANKMGGTSSPHKHLLLLAVLSLLDNEGHANSFTFQELEPVFVALCNQYYPLMHGSNILLEYPFYHLQSDGFWFLVIIESHRSAYRGYENTRLTKKRILETVDHAYLSPHIYSAMCSPETRLLMRMKISEALQIEEPKADNTVSTDRRIVQGQSLFAHEQAAIENIRDKVSASNARVVSNIMIFDEQSRSYLEYDIILVARSGLFVVELKHWSGSLYVKPYNWVVNGIHERPDPHRSNNFKCRVLKGIYQHRFRTYPDVYIESAVVLTHPEVSVQGASVPTTAAAAGDHNVTFSSITDFVKYLRALESGPAVINDNQVVAVAEHLQSLNIPRQGIKRSIPGYETVEYLSQKPDCTELTARRIDGRERGLNRFRIFRPPYTATNDEKERFLKKAYATLDAVSKIGDHPSILRVWVIENEDGDIIEGSDWSEIGTLRDLIAGPDQAFPVDQAIAICRGIASGLKEAHKADVIHRAVKPENVLMMNGIPKLMNFDLSYRSDGPRHVTVIPDTSKIKDDGYTAPDIIFDDDIDEGTDFFSLGVIAYELFTGRKPFKTVQGLVAQGGRLKDEDICRLEDATVPADIIEMIHQTVVAERAERLRDVEQILLALGAEIEQSEEESGPKDTNHELEQGSTHDLYEIVELIGQGSEAQIYRAKGPRGQDVAIKLFHKEIPRERIFRESEITSSINSSYVVHSENRLGHWQNDRYFIVMDCIEGECLRDCIDRGEIPDAETFQTVALCLMEALEAFHAHVGEDGCRQPYLHSDVKPDNVLITADSKAVLVDCGIAGEPRVDQFQGTIGYIPPDSILGSEMEFAVDADLFALGVTLCEWLFGQRPYAHPAIGDVPTIPGDAPDSERLTAWLSRAVATRKTDRFPSVTEMRDAFTGKDQPEEATAELPSDKDSECGIDQVTLTVEEETAGLSTATASAPACENLFVSYLNSLSNASAGNENSTAESQIGNPFFPQIFVENELSVQILHRLLGEKKNVILTGNAGDGKTTVASEIYRQIIGQLVKLEPEQSVPGHDLTIVKDMSELKEARRIEILRAAIEGDERTYLVVSNTGTLLETSYSLGLEGAEFEDLQSKLLTALEADCESDVLGGHFTLLNLARMDSIETACKVFRRMLEPKNWESCQGCSIGTECPVLCNVRLLQNSLDVVCNRVGLLYRRLYEYDLRLTLRQMTGHLGYAITGGQHCTGIKGLSCIARNSIHKGSMFFNRFFGDNGDEIEPQALQMQPVVDIRNAQFGAVLDPSFERRFWTVEGSPIALCEQAKAMLETLRPEQPNSSQRRQVRRLVFFFASLDTETDRRYVSVFLRSPMLLKFASLTRSGAAIKSLEERHHRMRILHVLQEFFTGVRMPEGVQQGSDRLYITLSRRGSRAMTQLVMAVFHTDDFELAVKRRYHIGGDGNGALQLRTKDCKAQMMLDLPFLDYVERRYEGEVSEELSAFYADRLERFKAELLSKDGRRLNGDQRLQLLRIGPDRKFKLVGIDIYDDRLEVLA